MQSSTLFRVAFRPSLYRASIGRYSTKTPTDLNEDNYVVNEDQTIFDIENKDIDAQAVDDEIERKRNKSGLLEQHRRMLNGQQPYDEAQSWIHNTLRYKRVMYGRYGAASGVDPRLLFPNASDREEALEYERVAYPKTLKQMIDENAARRRDEEAERDNREVEIITKMGKLEQWKHDLRERVAKREADAQAAIDKKARLIDEIRRQFGFKMDARDPRFKELLAQKEEDAKKAAKEAKKKQKETLLLQRIMQKPKSAEAARSQESVKASVDQSTETTDEIKESAPTRKRNKKKDPKPVEEQWHIQ